MLDTVRLRQALEQFGAGAQELAPLLAAYYDRLKQEGFAPMDAFQLTRDMQAHIVNLSKRGEE